MKRRDVIKGLGLIPLTGAISASGSVLPASLTSEAAATAPKRDLYKELGVTPLINASATMTFLSGSLMLPEVLEAIQGTSGSFANMYELQDKIGSKLAEMLKCEAAMVTSGATAAITLGTAACITGMDPKKIADLPSYNGPRPEVILQKTHDQTFNQAMRSTGAKLIEVNGPAEMEKAINSNTVMAFFLNCADKHSITHEEFLAIAKKRNIPTFIDAAADVPPVENLFKFQKMGFDMVTFSGGKMLRGPQSTGLFLGRKDLIEAAKLNASPRESPIGRAMKVNKEEMFGLYAAVKSYIERDHEKEWQDWLNRLNRISATLSKIPSIKCETRISPGPANAFPNLRVTWDAEKVKITPPQVLEALKTGSPAIISGGGKTALLIGVVTLEANQVDLVANRVKEILQKAI